MMSTPGRWVPRPKQGDITIAAMKRNEKTVLSTGGGVDSAVAVGHHAWIISGSICLDKIFFGRIRIGV